MDGWNVFVYKKKDMLLLLFTNYTEAFTATEQINNVVFFNVKGYWKEFSLNLSIVKICIPRSQ